MRIRMFTVLRYEKYLRCPNQHLHDTTLYLDCPECNERGKALKSGEQKKCRKCDLVLTRHGDELIAEPPEDYEGVWKLGDPLIRQAGSAEGLDRPSTTGKRFGRSIS